MNARLAVGVALLGLAPLSATAEQTAAPPPAPAPELLQARARTPGQPSLHPPIILRDGAGVPVAKSGEVANARQSCDGCHDVRWIEAHSYRPHTGLDGGCFMCHLREADRPHPERFAPDGSVPAAALGLGRPTDRACGACHGTVYEQDAPLALTRDSRQRMTDTQGIVFSPQRISDSAVNLAGKDALVRPWDVHAERMVSCASCHFSPNHPAYSFLARKPEHLRFDARRVEITEYLRRPDHRLAKGPSPQATAANVHDGSMRGCEDCHDAPKTHGWLPRADRHFSAMRCEACHVPMAYAPARQETDWTVPTANRQARVVYRGVRADGFVTGFRPVLLPREQADGTRKLAPHNLVTTWFWIDKTSQGARPIARETLDRAFLVGDGHRPELVRALDRNGDGRLQDDELILDTESKAKVARDLLLAAGATAPEIVGEIQPHGLHHGVGPGRFATQACSDCHTRDSRLDQPFVLAGATPVGVTPALVGSARLALPGTILRDAEGRLVLQPRLAGLHVFGHSRNGFVDTLGMLLFAGALAGATAHSLLRVRAARRRKKEPS